VKFVRDLNAEMATVGNDFENRFGSGGSTPVCDPRFGRRGKADQRTVTRSLASLNLGRSVLYKLGHRLRQRPKTSSLLPWKRGRGSDTRFLEPVREDLLTACIKDFYLVPEQPSLAALFQEARGRFAEHPRPAGNYRTVVRRVEGVDPGYVMAKRQGSKRACEKFGPVGVSTLRPDFSLDVVQIDHTLVDVMTGRSRASAVDRTALADTGR